jgi:hypothetical protein
LSKTPLRCTPDLFLRGHRSPRTKSDYTATYRFPVSCLISQRTGSRARETAREVITRNQKLKKIIDEQAEAERPLKTPQPMSNSGPSVAGNSATRPASSAPKTTPAAGHDLAADTNQLRQKVVAQEDTEKTLKQQISQDFTSASRKKNKRIVLSKGSDLRPPRRRKGRRTWTAKMYKAI